MSRALDDLCAGEHGHFDLRGAVIDCIARCAERKVFLYPIDTLRTKAEQEINVRRGFSKTMDSRHLPQPECGKAHACDVVPVIGVDDQKINTLEWDTHRPDGSPEPEWEVLREEAVGLGLQAGFGSGPSRWDLGHLQEAEEDG